MNLKTNILFASTKIINIIFSQLIFLLLFYMLNIKEFGNYIGILAIATLLQVITTGLTYGAFITFSTKDYVRIQTYKSIICYRVIFAVVIIFLVSLLLLFIDFNHREAILKLYLGLVFYDLGSQIMLPGKRKLHQVCIEFVFFVILLSAVMLFKFTYMEYINFYFFLTVLLFLISLFFYKILDFNCTTPKCSSSTKFNLFVKYSVWQMLGVLAIYIMGNGLNLYTYFYGFTSSDIALYGILLKIFMSLSPVYAIYVIYIPKLIHQHNITFQKVRKRFLVIVLLSSVMISLLYVLVITTFDGIVCFLNKSSYSNLYVYMLLMVPAYFFMSFSNIANTYLSNTVKYASPQIVLTIQGIVLCFSYLIFIPKYSFYGVVISLTITYLISFTLFLSIIFMENKAL